MNKKQNLIPHLRGEIRHLIRTLEKTDNPGKRANIVRQINLLKTEIKEAQSGEK